MDKNELRTKLDAFLKDEHGAAMEYVEFIQNLHEYTKDSCMSEELRTAFERLNGIPSDENRHWIILDQLKCALGV